MENNIKNITVRPAADVADRQNGVEISLEVPGVSENDLNIEIINGMLSITGKSSLCHRGKTVTFKRSFYISEAVDTDGITASVKDGVLTMFLPKSENTMPKKIKVS